MLSMLFTVTDYFKYFYYLSNLQDKNYENRKLMIIKKINSKVKQTEFIIHRVPVFFFTILRRTLFNFTLFYICFIQIFLVIDA